MPEGDRWMANLKEPLRSALFRSMKKPMRNHLSHNTAIEDPEDFVHDIDDVPEDVLDVYCEIQDKLSDDKIDQIRDRIWNDYMSVNWSEPRRGCHHIREVFYDILEGYGDDYAEMLQYECPSNTLKN